MASITLKNINKYYPNNVHAVHDFNLDIADKELIVFVGPSGCGKSTTLRMIAGLEDISSGELILDGKLMNYVPPKDRNVAMVFQNYALYPHMSVYDNMGYGIRIRSEFRTIYEKNDEIKNLIKEVKSKKKQLASIEKRFASNADDEELKKSYDDTFAAILETLQKIMDIRKPVMGKDAAREKRVKGDIAAMNRELTYVRDLMENEIKREDKDEGFVTMLKQDEANALTVISEKTKELEYLQNNEVEIQKKRHLESYEIDYEVFHAAEVLDLHRYLFRKPAALSGGQRQRVALGRAIVRRPKVFLMDEPLSNLDAKLRVQTRTEIAKLHKRVGATTIYVTHDQTEAMTLADRIVIMKDGFVQQIAEPMTCFNDPDNIFVGGFIGSPSMNFLKVKVQDGSIIYEEDGAVLFQQKLSAENVEILKAYEDKEVTLGVRPENIVPAEGEQASLHLVANAIELLGTDYIVYSNLGKTNINSKGSGAAPSEGTSLSYRLCDDKLYFFDSETTLRIRGESSTNKEAERK